ncbi:PREDICTED: F-box/SPRY domain-containing protein 1 [Rhinopithecus bieti]|nr:PREDICTED: F-box/SPRY domain-containing protein 1 [Rhinopithecus bieti]
MTEGLWRWHWKRGPGEQTRSHQTRKRKRHWKAASKPPAPASYLLFPLPSSAPSDDLTRRRPIPSSVRREAAQPNSHIRGREEPRTSWACALASCPQPAWRSHWRAAEKPGESGGFGARAEPRGRGGGRPCSRSGAGGRLPSRVLELVFSYLELSELRSCALVCKHWYRCLHGDENSEVWRSLCARSLAEEALRTDILCNLPSYKAKIRAFQHAFSTNDCSRNVYIKKNGFTLHRNPIAQSTDGARTKIGFSEGRHAWEVWWEGPLGTVAVIGIATKRAPMQCQGYVALLGSDDQSWGWNLVDNNLLHNGEVNGSFPQCNNAPKYQIGERIRVILDMEDKTLAFERGYEFLGVAFRGLPKVCLYPAVSAVYGNTEVTLVYLGKPLDG